MSTTGKVFGISDCKSFLFEAGKDYDRQKVGYKFFRHVTFDTASNPNGAYFQIGEIEYFGDDSFPVDPRAKLATTWGQHQRGIVISYQLPVKRVI